MLCSGGSSSPLPEGGYLIQLEFAKRLDPKKKYWEPILIYTDEEGKAMADIDLDKIPVVISGTPPSINGIKIITDAYQVVIFPFK